MKLNLTFILLLISALQPLCSAELTQLEQLEKTLFESLDSLKTEISRLNTELKQQSERLLNLESNDTIEDRVAYVEELSKLNSMRSCEELSRYGINKTDYYLVDPDGSLINQDPILVKCIFEGGSTITEIGHLQEETIVADHCDTEGCYNQTIDYGVPLSQIEALMALSESCEQSLIYGCFLAPLTDNDINYGGWFDRNSDPQYFFDGDHPGEHTCSCGEDNSCLTNGIDEFSCNCDAYFPIVANDTGLITAKNLLPITGVFYGPLMFETEFASFTVGRLRCRGDSTKNINPYDSCKNMKMAGNFRTEIYNLQSLNEKPRLALCNMEAVEGYEEVQDIETMLGYIANDTQISSLQDTDTDLQNAIQALQDTTNSEIQSLHDADAAHDSTLSIRGKGFSCFGSCTNGGWDGTLTYSGCWVNDDNMLASNGRATIVQSGVYSLTFYGNMESYDYNQITVFMKRSWSQGTSDLAEIHNNMKSTSGSGTGHDRDTNSMTVLVSLEAGDAVYNYVDASGSSYMPCDHGHYTGFSGFLVR